MNKEQTISINTKLLLDAHTKTETLCWLCKNACGGQGCTCSKVKYNKPVDGWTATSHMGDLGREWNVRSCPQFKFEWDRPQELADIMPILMYWLKGGSSDTAVRRRIYRNPEGSVALYNAMHPELPLILYKEDDVMIDEDEDSGIEL